MNCFFFPMTFRYYPMASKNFPRAYLFPNGMFQLPNDIFRLPNVFYSRKLSLSLIFIIHPDTRTTISDSQKQKKQTSTTASGSAIAFPFTCRYKVRKWKNNRGYVSALIWVSKRIMRIFLGIKMHEGYQNAFFKAFLYLFGLFAVNIHSGAFRYIP